MRAMMESGIVPSATAGRIMWRKVSQKTGRLSVSNELNKCMLDRKEIAELSRPGWRLRFQASWMVGTIRPGELRPEGGNWKGVSLSVRANR